MFEAALRELLSKQEQHASAIRRANEEYIGALKQLIEVLLRGGQSAAPDPSEVQ